ncbi:MAG: barnase inhibitor [Chloroflexi bacterium]|nr:MAG: barnase inhibitor [Chloroflexota bacterium]
MSKLQLALTQERTPGMYRFDSRATVEFLRNEADAAGWQLFYLDGAKVRDKKSFLAKAARALNFPAYFGHNWDAFEECVNDLSWAPASGYILLFQAPERLVKNARADWEIAVEILSTAIENWNELGVPFFVLLRGTVPGEFPAL